MSFLLEQDEKRLIRIAYDRAIRNYILSRKQKIPGFVKTNFSFSGAAKINRKALGWDIIKAPLNLAWQIPNITIKSISPIFNKIGLKKIDDYAKKIPNGIKTAVQDEIDRLIIIELLELPYKNNKIISKSDTLLSEILNQPEIKHLFQTQLDLIYSKFKQEGFRQALEKRLQDYSVSRIAISELAGNVISLASGASMMGKVTPGGISFGAGLAAAITQQSAINNFFLGPAIGGIYYGIFPTTASLGLLLASTSAILAVLAMVTSLSGLITDPVLAQLGIHEKRLNQMLDSLEDELLYTSDSNLKFSEQYLARIFDILDCLKIAANTIV